MNTYDKNIERILKNGLEENIDLLGEKVKIRRQYHSEAHYSCEYVSLHLFECDSNSKFKYIRVFAEEGVNTDAEEYELDVTCILRPQDGIIFTDEDDKKRCFTCTGTLEWPEPK